MLIQGVCWRFRPEALEGNDQRTLRDNGQEFNPGWGRACLGRSGQALEERVAAAERTSAKVETRKVIDDVVVENLQQSAGTSIKEAPIGGFEQFDQRCRCVHSL